MKKTSGGIFCGWIIVAAGTFCLAVSNGLSILGIPVFYKHIREDFVKNGAALGILLTGTSFGGVLISLMPRRRFKITDNGRL